MAQKKIVLYEEDTKHADLRLKLRYDRITQSKFFRTVIDLYLERDANFLDSLYKKTKISSRNQTVIDEDFKEKEETEKTFGLNPEEIEDIFDLIAIEDEDI